MANKTFKEISKGDWHSAGGPVSNEQIKVGALQRIADAAEVMAQNYVKLQDERDKYKRWYEQERQSNERIARRMAALQGVITKLKKKAR
jgi:hypothetical protein